MYFWVSRTMVMNHYNGYHTMVEEFGLRIQFIWKLAKEIISTLARQKPYSYFYSSGDGSLFSHC